MRLRTALKIMLWLFLLSLPRQLWATDNCFQCVLGIWDDPALTSNFGQIVPGEPKDVYVGIKFAEGFDRLSGIEFSVAAPSAIYVTSANPIATVGGWPICNPQAPADTSLTSIWAGGCTFAWPRCLVGNQALVRVTLIALNDVTNAILWVKRNYPPDPPEVKTPLIFNCDGPQFTPTRVSGGYYILNWNGDPSVRIDGATWSGVKHLFR
jgi:hypothetical protein